MSQRLRRLASRFVNTWAASFAFLVACPGAIAADAISPISFSTTSAQADAHTPHGTSSRNQDH